LKGSGLLELYLVNLLNGVNFLTGHQCVHTIVRSGSITPGRRSGVERSLADCRRYQSDLRA